MDLLTTEGDEKGGVQLFLDREKRSGEIRCPFSH
jgi:hypothetical protein